MWIKLKRRIWKDKPGFEQIVRPMYWRNVILKNQTWWSRRSSLIAQKILVRKNKEYLIIWRLYNRRTRILVFYRKYLPKFAKFLVRSLKITPFIRVHFTSIVRRYAATPWTDRFVAWLKVFKLIGFYVYKWLWYLIKIVYALKDELPIPTLLFRIHRVVWLAVVFFFITYKVYNLFENILFSVIDAILMII